MFQWSDHRVFIQLEADTVTHEAALRASRPAQIILVSEFCSLDLGQLKKLSSRLSGCHVCRHSFLDFTGCLIGFLQCRLQTA